MCLWSVQIVMPYEASRSSMNLPNLEGFPGIPVSVISNSLGPIGKMSS